MERDVKAQQPSITIPGTVYASLKELNLFTSYNDKEPKTPLVIIICIFNSRL